jgi:hypothetical protein
MMSRYIAFFVFLSLLLLPGFAEAQIIPRCSSTGLPSNPALSCAQILQDPTATCGVCHIFALLISIFNFLLGLAAILLLLFAIIAGARMIIFQFSEQPESELVNARLTLTRAIFGFAIIAGAMIIVNTVLFVIGLNSATPIGSLLCSFGLGC